MEFEDRHNENELMNQNYDSNGFFATTGPQSKIRSSQSSGNNQAHQGGLQRNSNINIEISSSG